MLVAIGISDLIDGAVARRFALTSNLGSMLDAMADKLAQIVTVTFLVFVNDIFTPLAIWLWTVLVARDGVLGIGWWWVHIKYGGVLTEHRWHGKLASALLFGLILAALSGVSSSWIQAGSAPVVLLVVPSTLVYLRQGWRQLRRPSTTSSQGTSTAAP